MLLAWWVWRIGAVAQLRPSPAIGLIVVLAAVPLRLAAGLSTSFAEIGLTEAAIPLAIVWTILFRRPGRFFLPRQLIWWGAFLAFAVLSITWAQAIGPAIKEFVKWAQLLIALVLTCDLARNRGDLEVLIRWGGAIVVAEIGLTALLLPLGGGLAVNSALPRLAGTFGQPNPFGAYVAIAFAFALPAALSNHHRVSRYGRIVAALAALAVLASLSRGAIVSLVGIAAVSVWALRLPSWRSWLFSPPALLAGLVAAAAFVVVLANVQLPAEGTGLIAGDVRPREVIADPSPGSFSVEQRLGFWLAAADMTAAHPLGGVGLGNFDEAYGQFFVSPWNYSLGHAHNLVLNTAAELGLLGAALLMVALISSFLPAIARARSPDPDWIDVGAAALLAGFLLHGLFDYMIVGGLGVIIGIGLGIGLRRPREVIP